MRAGGALRAVAAVAIGGSIVLGAQQYTSTLDVSRASDRAQTSGADSVAASTAVCPGPDDDGTRAPSATTATSIYAALAPAQLVATDARGDGSTNATRLPASAGSPQSLKLNRGAATDFAAQGPGSVLVTGAGGFATGMLAMQQSLADATSVRGALLMQCVAPASDQWLAGGGAGAGDLMRLVLTNPSAVPVTATADVVGARGADLGKRASGILVPARGRTVVVLGSLGAVDKAALIHVTTTSGALGAALLDESLQGETRLGAALNGPIAPSGQDLVIPGVVATSAVPHVRVAVPGAESAVVRVRATNAHGVVAIDKVTTAAAGATTDVELAGLPAGTYSVRVTTDVDVVAAARMSAGGSGTSDFAWVPAAPEITQLAGVIVPKLAADTRETVSLAARTGSASVDVTTVDAGGGSTTKTIAVQADRPTLIDAPSGSTMWLRVRSGSIYAAAAQVGRDKNGPLLAATALQPVAVNQNVTGVSAQPR